VLARQNFAIVTRNAVLREGLTAQIRALGGEVVPLPHFNRQPTALEAVLVDAGPAAKPDLPSPPQEGIRSVVMIVPEARGELPQLKQLGFPNYLVKPLRQSSLAEWLRSPGREDAVPPVVTLRNPTPPPRPEMKQATSAARRILLAEDNPINAMLIRELLRRRGHSVHDVGSGEAALETTQHQSFDLILTDIHMPGMDGIETARRFREREIALGRSRTPIVALTADAVETGKHACQDAGMDGFLTKPVDPAELDAMLLTLLPMDETPAEAAA